jgi:hypothetical protein
VVVVVGFMDKVKQQAGGLAQKAQEGAKAGQDKLAGMQAKKHADALLQELGGIVYCQRQGRPGTRGGWVTGPGRGPRAPPAHDRVAAIFTQLQEYEATHGQITPTSADAPTGGPTGEGGFVPGGGGAPETSTGSTAEGTMPATSGYMAGSGMPMTGGIPQSGGIPQPVPDAGGGVPQPVPDAGGGIPQAAPDPAAAPPPTAAPQGGGIPTASYSSDEGSSEEG